MIIDCPACGAGLFFDPETGKMKCEACDSLFDPHELEEIFKERGEKELKKDFAKNDSTSGGLKLAGDNDISKPINHESTPGGLKLADAAGVAGTSVTTAAGVLSNAAVTDTDSKPSFNPESDFDTPVFDHASNNGSADDNNSFDSNDTMECSIYTCTSCGAEVAINNVEASTFCSFCGQPTVVFNRVASQKKPKYIIPFSVTKDRAITLIRQRLEKGFYVPDAIKNFEIERVRGIYVPFWLYDIYYHDSQYIRGTVGSGKNSHTYYYFREADCDFKKLTLDASRQLNDELSQRLEPFYKKDIKEFSLEYLSGFYSDCYDVKTSELDGLAITRAKIMFQEEVNKTVKAHSLSVIKNDPSFRIEKTEYAMFPAWFLTFRYENTPYTLLVNGQTEKIIGGVPYDRAKVATSFGILATIITVIATFIINLLLSSDDGDSYKIILYILIFAGSSLGVGLSTLKKVKESTVLTSLSETTNFVKDRGK